MLNTLNCYRKAREIIFKMLKETKACIREDSVLRAGFLIDQGDGIGKKEKREDRNAKVSNSKIKLALKNKEKDKEGKQSFNNIRKFQTKIFTNIKIPLPKLIIKWLVY